MLDLIVRGGTVVDGSGLTPYPADVGISGDRIVRIGRINERGRNEVDAEGHVVTPGFIDGHTHMDAQVMWDSLGSCSCWHGITSVVMGNCGFTLAPAASDRRELVVRNLERAEDISAEAMAQGIDWTWESYADYLNAVDARPKGINYAGYVGHSALRTWAMGERAFAELATEDDMQVMERALIDALQAGAVGMSTSRTLNHETSDNRPVASRLAAWDEVTRLVGRIGEQGSGGLFELALEPTVHSTDPVERAEALGRLRALAVGTGVSMTFGIGGTYWRDMLALLDSAAADGGRIFGQSHSRGATIVLSFKTQLPFDRLPEWRAVRALSLPEQRRAFSDPAVREKLVRAAHESDYGRSIGTEARPPNYAMIQILRQPLPPHQTVAELAAARNADPVDVMIDLALESDFNQLFVQRLTYTDDPEGDLLATMRHPRTVMTFSDSGAHVSQIMDASIQTHLLGYWVRERQAFTLQQAVQMLTMAPAVAFGFADRGLLREGMVADINVFDPATIGPDMPSVVADLPGGSKRLIQHSKGIRSTIVAGQPVYLDGEHTGAYPGRLLRRQWAS